VEVSKEKAVLVGLEKAHPLVLHCNVNMSI